MSNPNLCLSLNGIPYAEYADQNKIDITPDSSTQATRTFVCKYSDAIALTNYLYSGLQFISNGFTYVWPLNHPVVTNLFVRNVSIKPFKVSATDINWDYAELIITYGLLNVSSNGGTFDPREYSLEPVSKTISIPRETLLVSGSTKTTVEDDEIFILKMYRYKVTLKRIHQSNLANILGLQGCVGTGNFTVRMPNEQQTVPGEQVLYEGPDNLKYTLAATGLTYFDLTHTFLISPISHQKVYNPSYNNTTITDRFSYAVNSSGQNVYKYPTADLSVLGV